MAAARGNRRSRHGRRPRAAAAKPAFSSKRWSRGPAWSSTSATSYCCGGRRPKSSSTRRGRAPRTRRGRSRAAVSGKAYVRTERAKWDGPGRLARVEKRVPSGLASTRPWGMARLPIAIETARAVKRLGNSSWIQAGAPPSGIGSATVLLDVAVDEHRDVEVAAALRHLRRRSAIRLSPSGTR